MKTLIHGIMKSIAIATTLGASAAWCQSPAATGPGIVGRHSISFAAPVGEPTQLMARGPLLGNGDVGVMQSGPGDQLVFYIGKNDFWSIKSQSPVPVGRIRIHTPELRHSSYHAVTDLRLAEVRGSYASGEAAMTSCARVDANRNLFCVELANTGRKPLAFVVDALMGASDVPAAVPTSQSPAMIACEQHGGGRWFFNGELADVAVIDRALSPEEVTSLAGGPRREVMRCDGKSGKPLAAPVATQSVSITGWIRALTRSGEADYIVSKGEWNQAYSLGLSNGSLRFAIGGHMVQTAGKLPLNEWVHVAGVFDGQQMSVFVDGKVQGTEGSSKPAGDSFLHRPDAPNPDGREVGVALRVVGAEGPGFTLAPGKSVVVAAAIVSDLDAKGGDPLAEARSLVGGLTPEVLDQMAAGHRRWWEQYWNRSFIEIPDKTIEQFWYASWYIMGSCSRAGKVAPGLWGNWLTVNNPAWHGDYHMNYNFQAPFYGLYASNHADVTLPFYDAVNQFIPRAKSIAAARGWKGVHLPVSIGPWGMCPEGDHSDWGQRSNAAYAALPYIWYWQHTRDKEWLEKTGYEFLNETAAFWEHYLKDENGRYVIYRDSIHEGSGDDMNPILTLGLLKTLFRNMPGISEELGVDAGRRAKWRDIAARLSDFPLQIRGGKTVFRYTEKGMDWCNGNTLGIQHIFPAGAIGLDSDPKLIEISRNMIDAMGRWRDSNGASSWYAACARVGYDPERSLSELNRMYSNHALPNKLLNFGGGGIENVSPALGVTEMLMQSHEGVIRLFPCWPLKMDARFGSLRAVGAFLVSAELKGGGVSGVTILSEKGGDVTILNPWPDQVVRVVRNGAPAESVSGGRITIGTTVNETIALAPE